MAHQRCATPHRKGHDVSPLYCDRCDEEHLLPLHCEDCGCLYPGPRTWSRIRGTRDMRRLPDCLRSGADPLHVPCALGRSGLMDAVELRPPADNTPATRIHRRRVHGWRKPPNTVIVDRTSRWGNPFPVRCYGRVLAVDFYRAFLTGHGTHPPVPPTRIRRDPEDLRVRIAAVSSPAGTWPASASSTASHATPTSCSSWPPSDRRPRLLGVPGRHPARRAPRRGLCAPAVGRHPAALLRRRPGRHRSAAARAHGPAPGSRAALPQRPGTAGRLAVGVPRVRPARPRPHPPRRPSPR